MKIKNKVKIIGSEGKEWSRLLIGNKKKSKKNNKKKHMKILTEKTENVTKCKEIKLTEFEPYV